MNEDYYEQNSCYDPNSFGFDQFQPRPFEDGLDIGSPGVDGPPIMSEDPYAYIMAAYQVPPLPDYIPGPEEPQLPPPLDFVPEPMYPEYMPQEDEILLAEEQPLPAASPTTNSPGYVPESDLEEEPEEDDEDPEEDPTDYPADRDDDDDDDDDEDEDEDEEEEVHPAPADSVPPVHRMTARFLVTKLAAMVRLRAETPSTSHPLPLPTSSPLLQLLSFDQSSAAAAARPIGGRRADYGFVDTVDAEISRRRAEEVGYGIRDAWVDPRDAAEEVALTTLEGVNTRVTELAAVQEQDTQDIYGVIEDTQGRQTQIFQRVEALVDDRQYHYETARLLDQEAMFSREAWAHSMGLGSAIHYELQGYMTHTWVQDQRIDAQDSLIATLTAQLSSLQGHLATALGEIRALQARDHARAGAPEGAGSSA
ncbi:hypothetical protein Tco_0425301 [Tanacetum coccineum]